MYFSDHSTSTSKVSIPPLLTKARGKYYLNQMALMKYAIIYLLSFCLTQELKSLAAMNSYMVEMN